MAKPRRRSVATRATQGPPRTGLELCSGSYKAEQVPGTVILTATGIHPTTGYAVFLEQTPLTVFPPEFVLLHRKPSGITQPALTPFSEPAHFHAASPVGQLVVHDEQGRHVVKVSQAPDSVVEHFTATLAKDGPFPMAPGAAKRSRASRKDFAKGAWLHLQPHLAALASAHDLQNVWGILQAILQAWSGLQNIGFDQQLEGLWMVLHAAQPFDPIGIGSLSAAILGNPTIGACARSRGVGPGAFRGNIKTPRQLLALLNGCA